MKVMNMRMKMKIMTMESMKIMKMKIMKNAIHTVGHALWCEMLLLQQASCAESERRNSQ